MCESGELVLRLERFVREALQSCSNISSEVSLNSTDGSENIERRLLTNLLSLIGNNNSSFYNEEIPGSQSNATGSADWNLDPTEEPHSTINKLEMIKVVVLIVVILIILITTCRMVFQLSMRFRPEKNVPD